MNYFIHDERDLSPAYVKSCKKFLKEISLKLQAASLTMRLGYNRINCGWLSYRNALKISYR